MRRELCLTDLACYGGGYNGGTVPVADIVLNDQHGTKSALLAAYDGTQIRIINISSFDIQVLHTLFALILWKETLSEYIFSVSP